MKFEKTTRYGKDAVVIKTDAGLIVAVMHGHGDELRLQATNFAEVEQQPSTASDGRIVDVVRLFFHETAMARMIAHENRITEKVCTCGDALGRHGLRDPRPCLRNGCKCMGFNAVDPQPLPE